MLLINERVKMQNYMFSFVINLKQKKIMNIYIYLKNDWKKMQYVYRGFKRNLFFPVVNRGIFNGKLFSNLTKSL